MGSHIIFYNFRARIQRPLGKRFKALLFTTSEEAFDAITSIIKRGDAKDSNEVLARALEKHLDLPQGSASIKSSDQK
jgi:hypothetical protein